MKSTLKWLGERSFEATSGSGHAVVMSGSASAENAGASPMEHVLMGLGGCAAYDVVEILEKMRQPLASCEVRLEAERAAEPPRVFTKVTMTFVVSGDGLDRAKVERAAKLSADKYCSASAMIGKTAEIVHAIELVGDDS